MTMTGITFFCAQAPRELTSQQLGRAVALAGSCDPEFATHSNTGV
jgi:hypothetical protein